MDKSRQNSLFGKQLNALRSSKGITPSEFNRLTKINEDTLQQLEDGLIEPSLSQIIVIADALKISHLELLNIDFKGTGSGSR